MSSAEFNIKGVKMFGKMGLPCKGIIFNLEGNNLSVGIIEFSNIFGATAYVGAKFIRKKWRFIKLEDLHVTRNGNYRVNIDLAFSKGLEFDEIIGESIQTKLL
jgi:Holliday junction resolvase